MSRSRSSALVLALLPLASPVPCAHAVARLEVSGEVVGRSPRLEVRVIVSNHGDDEARPLEVVGELLGEHREARVVRGVAPGAQVAVILDFDPSPVRAGLHALTLLLEHPIGGASDAAGNRPVASQRAFLLLALGARPDPAVRIEALPASIDVQGPLEVRMGSADGERHRVRLRALPARGLRAPDPPSEITVPAGGVVSVPLRLVRAGAARGSRHGVVVVAETLDGPLARTSVVAATVDVDADPAILPRVRSPLFVLALVLLSLAAIAEMRRRRWRPPGG